MITPDADRERPAFEPSGRYLLGREIGQGAMGCVFEATHRALAKKVAIKRLHGHLAANPASLARFVGEGRAIARVRHSHVVEVFDLEEQDGTPFFVMELLLGCTLAERLSPKNPLSLSQTVDLALPLVSALSAAHAASVVHRDIKPSNVFLRRGELTDPCVVDFGVSKHAAHSAVEELTQSGIIVGSYPYFSPEHTRGARNVTPRSDQYSLAVVLYECVTGARPFEGESAYELMHAIATREVRPPSSLCPSVPCAFDDVLLRAMRRDPQERFPTMHAFGSALLGFANRRAWHVWSSEFGSVGPEVASLEATAEEARAPCLPARRRRIHAAALIPFVCAAALLGTAARALVGGPPAPPLLQDRSRLASESAAVATAPTPIDTAPRIDAEMNFRRALVVERAVDAAAPGLKPARPHPVAPAIPKPIMHTSERGSNGVPIFD